MQPSEILVNQAPNAIAMFDTNMRYLAASKKWMTDYQLQGIDVIGKSHYEVFPEIGEEWKQIHRVCLAGAINQNDNASFMRQDGTEQWLSWDVRPWYHTDGIIGGLIMYTEDITYKKLVEKKLKESEEQFRSVFESSAIGIAIISPDGGWVKVNSALCTILGYQETELKNLTFQDITHPDDLEADLSLVNQVLSGRLNYYQIEKRYKHKEGVYIWAILSVSAVRNEVGSVKHFISQITDINNLRLLQKKLEGILDASTNVSIISTNTNGIISSFNAGAENMLGYKKEEVLNKFTPALIHEIKETEARGKELSSYFGQKIEGFDVFVKIPQLKNFETREWTYVHKNGFKFPVLLTVTAIKDHDEISGYLGIATDISQLKKAQQEIQSVLEVTNEQNERLKNFAHIVSHNLRSHSTNINLLVDMLIDEPPGNIENPIIKHLSVASNHLKETINHLNEVVLLNTELVKELKKIHLRTIIQNVVSSVSALATENNVRIENNTSKASYVLGNEAYLSSIILNLITNAIKYRFLERASFLKIYSEETPEYIIITFEDNGLGMNMKQIGHKLFGMYKTFHGNKDARGIGLFITKNQIEAMGGKIEVDSTEGTGTIFKVFLKFEKD